jgi:hypothetical protein
MRREELIGVVQAALGPFLAEYGFLADQACVGDFVRAIPNGDQRVSPEVFRWPAETKWHVTFRLKVRLDAVERMLRDYGVRGGGKPDPCVSAVNRLIDNLYPKTITAFDWEVGGSDDIHAVAEDMAERLRTYALPFFDSLSDVEGLRKALEREDGNWPTPTAELRAALLVICLVLSREAAAIEAWLPRLRDSASRSKQARSRDQLGALVVALRKEFPDLLRDDL